ncbi:trypsin-like peptidase domain-containing protein [Streptomyces sp. NPDC052396]|uniref:VMAP-C domain-containing protein n=1 Tax=Streptomyces sp. NPDC052396 TaxID=3365689 RepID=UPI0037D3B7C9
MSSLEGAVRRSVVRICAAGGGKERDGDRFWGSGFFIAPGLVLTCAHVVGVGGGGVLDGGTALDITDWRERTTEGRVVFALPRVPDPDRPPYPWPLPDLALVEVAGAQDAECLWLSDRSAVVPAPVSLHGWSRELGELALRFGTGTASGGDGDSAMLLRGEIPVEGCSGGPVLDTGRGAVIGVSKGRGQDTAGLAVPVTALRRMANDLPGRARLHAIVRAHDRHHLQRYRAFGATATWTGLQRGLRPHGQGFTPVLRTQLFAQLAELPPPGTPGEVMALVDEVKSRVIQDPYQPGVEHDPRSWREGVGLLYDLRDGGAGSKEDTPGATRDLEVEAVLLYAAHVAAAVSALGRAEDERALRELGGWLTLNAETLELPDVIRQDIRRILYGGSAGFRDEPPDAPQGAAGARDGAVVLDPRPTPRVDPPRRPVRARADVIVEVDPLLYGDHYPWRIKLLREDDLVTPLYGDERGETRGQLWQALREPVADALRKGDVGQHLAALQMILPRELFDEPLDAWRLTPPGGEGGPIDPHTVPLGQRRVVYLRDRRRRDEPAIPEWISRWKGAERGGLTAVPLRKEVPWCGHGGGRRESGYAAYARLSEVPDTAVPVYCGPVASGEGAQAMEAALAAGHAVVIWRRCASEHSDCADFHERVGELLHSVGRSGELHRTIRSLRRRCADPEADQDVLWARSIAVLFDSPERPPLPDALRAPGTVR